MPGLKGKSTWNKGLTSADPRVSKGSKKTSSLLKGRDLHKNLTTEQKEQKAEKCRIAIEKRYAAGWMPKAGRCKKIIYESKIAGTVSLDGSYELRVAKILDKMAVEWKRNIKKFKYADAVGRVRNYTPDFYVKDWSSYIEVKGYETEQDRCKWRDFTDKLLVWKKEQILELEIANM